MMKNQLSRTIERHRAARFLNSLNAEDLWRFGISRISEIGGFDMLGVPVWTSTRPLSRTISINSGKGLSTMMARAGTIAESIEFSCAENPKPVHRLRTISQMSRWRDFTIVAPESWQLAKGAQITDLSVFDWDTVSRIQELDQLNYLIPSEAIYLSDLNTVHLRRFQTSSNGWASGASLEDAVLGALYEVVERDGWTIWHWLIEHQDCWPWRMDLSAADDWPWLQETLTRFDQLGIKPVLFDISTDTSLPVVWALLYDLTDQPAGLFSGFGCAWTKTAAIVRAITEAVQGRACYIAGARDDMLRRSFLLLKSFAQPDNYARLMNAPTGASIDFGPEPAWTAKEELTGALQILASTGFTDFYVREAGSPFKGNPFSVVKVVAPCLESYRCGYWTPSKRLFDYVSRYAK